MTLTACRRLDVTAPSSADGVDVRDDPTTARSAWCRSAPLFAGTVASNLRYGDADASDDDLWRALELAQAKPFVEGLEGGLEALIAGGTNASGGQRQRLAIARALVKKPRTIRRLFWRTSRRMPCLHH